MDMTVMELCGRVPKKLELLTFQDSLSFVDQDSPNRPPAGTETYDKDGCLRIQRSDRQFASELLFFTRAAKEAGKLFKARGRRYVQ